MKIKKPSSLSPRQRRETKQIACMAGLIKNQAMLDKLLDGAGPVMREAMLERVKPHLRFAPKEEVTADCPLCGLRRGTAISHQCLTDTRDQAQADHLTVRLPAPQ